MKKIIYVAPTSRVIQIDTTQPLAGSIHKTLDNRYGFQNDPTSGSGSTDPNSSSFGEDYGDLFSGKIPGQNSTSNQ